MWCCRSKSTINFSHNCTNFHWFCINTKKSTLFIQHKKSVCSKNCPPCSIAYLLQQTYKSPLKSRLLHYDRVFFIILHINDYQCDAKELEFCSNSYQWTNVCFRPIKIIYKNAIRIMISVCLSMQNGDMRSIFEYFLKCCRPKSSCYQVQKMRKLTCLKNVEDFPQYHRKMVRN